MMNRENWIRSFLTDVVGQNEKALRTYFTEDAVICWHNTNEQFNVAEYIRADCEYPGRWLGEAVRIDLIGEKAVSVARVWCPDDGLSFHVVSFYEFKEDRISRLDEYWGDDGTAPQWRLEKKIGQPISVLSYSKREEGGI